LEAKSHFRNLYLNSNQIVDLAPLSGLTTVGILQLANNFIDDLTPLSGLTSVESLGLSENLIVDLGGLEEKEILTLNLARNLIVDISPLSFVTGLHSLDLSGNLIGDIGALPFFCDGEGPIYKTQDEFAEGCVTGGGNLWLDLRNNRIRDVSALVVNPSINDADTVVLVANPLSEQTVSIDIPLLGFRGVDVRYDGQQAPGCYSATRAGAFSGYSSAGVEGDILFAALMVLTLVAVGRYRHSEEAMREMQSSQND
jgi:hypothetical protein